MTHDSDVWQRVREVFEGAVALPPERRASFVAAACGGDDQLQEQVVRLLASHERADTFLERPAIAFAEEQASGSGLEGRRIGPYLVGSRLGAGGMGEVYRADDTRLKRTVAIKVLAANVADSAAARARFDREAKAAAALSHPHICTLYDIGHDGDVDFLVMECLEGSR